jgi:hypothetical protein
MTQLKLQKKKKMVMQHTMSETSSQGSSMLAVKVWLRSLLGRSCIPCALHFYSVTLSLLNAPSWTSGPC